MPKRPTAIVLTRHEVEMLYSFAAGSERARTFRIIEDRSVRYVENLDGTRFRLTAERLGQ